MRIDDGVAAVLSEIDAFFCVLRTRNCAQLATGIIEFLVIEFEIAQTATKFGFHSLKLRNRE